MKKTSNVSRKLKMGAEGLDDILGGGLPENHVYLLEGNPGSGKTTLALQFLLEGVKQGESGLYVTLSESASELDEVARSHGWTLEHMNVHELSVAQDNLMPDGQYTFFHPSEVELGETTKGLMEEVERSRPKRVVFDSLSEMRLLARDPLRYRRQILGLKQFFLGRDCTVLLIDDLTSGDSDLQPQSLAHGVITLQQHTPIYGAERRRLKVSKLRGVKFRGGYHDFNLETGGVKVFPRLVAGEHSLDFKRERFGSGIKKLDDCLGGGLDRGSSNLIVGPAGVGKSSLCAQFACSMASKGKTTSFFIFDEVVRTFVDRCEGLGMPVAKYMKKGLIKVQQVDPAEISPGEFTHKVKCAVLEDKSDVVVVDSLNGYMLSMPEERFLVAQLHEVFSFLNQMGVISLLVASQQGITSGATSFDNGINVSYLSDSTIHLRFFEAQGRIRKAISIIKKRSSNHEDAIRELTLSEKGIQVGEPLTQFNGILTGVPTFTGKSSDLMG